MKSVVFTFGRMNPPTTGHQLLVNKLVAYAHQNKSTPRVYLSHSVGKKDPLQYDKKLSFARAAFGAIVRKSNSKNVIQILKDLQKEGFTHVTMFAGSDRVPEFTKLLNAYNGKEYTFEKITVKSAGERDPDADDVSGMSASKMRALAKDEKIAEFLRGAPNTLKVAQAKSMYAAVRKALLGEDAMEYGHNERFLEFIFESDMKDDDFSDLPSDGEITKHFDSLSADDLDLDDSDAMMLDIIVDGEESDNNEMNEAKVLGFQQRQKLSQRMKSMSKRLARLRQIKAKQMPAQQRLKMRARKAAIMLLRKRATGKKNLEYSSLSRSQRIAVDTALVQRFGKNLNSLVGRLATRLMPRVRKQAQEYTKKAREVKESLVFEAKEKEGSAKDVAQDKIQAAKRGMSVADWEKTKADAKHDSPLNIDPTKLDTLKIDPTKNDREAPNPKHGHLHLNRKLAHYARSVDEGRKGTVDAQDAGDTNIMYQLRKVLLSRGNHEVVFSDKSKHKISVADANKMLDKFAATRLPADKHDMTIQAGKSLASFKNVLAHGIEKQGKKISLGGKQFKEFYMGTGRNRTNAPYPQDSDEPPGTRRIAEVAKDEDRPSDPNRSRPLSQKLDLLLRLGLSDADELQKYRRALRSSKKAALQSPEMRSKLADLLDKLIDLTTQDPATYSRVRYRVQTKEAYALLNKAEKSGVDVDIIFEVFARGYEENEDINEAFNRVNSFIAGGKAADMDKDLSEKVKAPTGGLKSACWKGYTAVGMKMKNGRKVPNCVPKEETQVDENKEKKQPKAWGEKEIKQYSDTHIQKDWKNWKPKGKKPYNPKTMTKEETQVEGYIVKYHDDKGKYKNSSRVFKDKSKADAHAERGNRITRVGGKYTVHQISDMGHEVKEGQANWAKARKDGERSTVAYLNYGKKKSFVDRKFTPYKADLAKDSASAMKDFLAKGGSVQKIEPGKKTIKSYVKPKKYMTPNQASKITEQMSTHEPTPLSQRTKRVKSFHAWHPKPTNEANRRVDVKMVKVKLPDGKIVYRKEHKKAAVQMEASHPHPMVQKTHPHPTGKVPYAGQTNKELATNLTKKVKAASEGYTGSEPTSSNKNDPSNRFMGTDALRKNYAAATPGQTTEFVTAPFAADKPAYTMPPSDSDAGAQRVLANQAKQDLSKKHLSDIRKALGGIRESNDLNESFAAGFELAPLARDYGITVQSSFEHHPEVQEALDTQEDAMNEAIYQGRNVQLNKPMKGDVKKSKVYVRDPSTGNIKKVNFGDKKLSIKKDQPARKRSYCARSSGQGNLTKKTSANYWSRRAWNC